MKLTIWKFQGEVFGSCGALTPQGARLLSVGAQHGEPTAWLLVDPDAPKVRRRLRIVGTGNPMSEADARIYAGTFFDGPYVWHVFDLGEA